MVLRPSKLRVLTLVDTLDVGGAERMAATIAARLDRERFEPSVCVTRSSEPKPLADDLRASNVEILWLRRTHRAALWDWRPLVNFLKRRQIHVIHSHKFGSNAWAVILGRLADVPVVVAHEHGASFERNRLHYFIEREVVARGADVLVTVSRRDRARMIELAGVRPAKVRVIANGILPPAAAETDLRRELGLSSEIPLIGTVAVLRPEKAVETLVEATALLVPQFPDIRVLIAGSGGEEDRLHTLIRRLNLEQTVLLLGFRRDTAEVFASLDVAVFSSVREGMPLAVIEAMAAGRPIVATRVGGIPELVNDGDEALLVPPRDPAALANAVASLLLNGELRERLGSRARQRQREALDIQTTVRSFELMYDELFAASRRGPRT